MKTNRSSLPHKASKTRVSRVFGFSLVEAIVTIATLGILAGTAVSVVGGANEAAHNARLQRDVAVLNSAVASYQTAGGPNIKQYDGVNPIAIANQKDLNDVLLSLKSRIINQAAPTAPGAPTIDIANRTVGIEGPFLDPQLNFQSVQVPAGRLYAYWDKSLSRFAVADSSESPPSGAGVNGFNANDANPRISRFFVDDSLTFAGNTEYRPVGTRTYNTENGWVWGSEDALRGTVASVAPVSRDQEVNQTTNDTRGETETQQPNNFPTTPSNPKIELDPTFNVNPEKLQKPEPTPATTEFATFAAIQNVVLKNTNENGAAQGKSYVAYRTAKSRNAQNQPEWSSWSQGQLGGDASVEVPKNSDKVPEFLIEYYAFSNDPNWLQSDDGSDTYTIAIRTLATPKPSVDGGAYDTFSSLPKNVILDNPNEDNGNEAKGSSAIKYRVADNADGFNSLNWLTANSVDDFNLILTTASKYKNKYVQYYAEPSGSDSRYWKKSSDDTQIYTMTLRQLSTPVPMIAPNLWVNYLDVPLSVPLEPKNENPEAIADRAFRIAYRTGKTLADAEASPWQEGALGADNTFTIPRRSADYYVQYYTKSADGDFWLDSPSASGNYETIYFSGDPAVTLNDPTGDTNFATYDNFENNNQRYVWGQPAGDDLNGKPNNRKNSIDIINGVRFDAAVNEEFKIADLNFFNSTISTSTGAFSVNMAIKLLGIKVTNSPNDISGNVKLDLLSSPNRSAGQPYPAGSPTITPPSGPIVAPKTSLTADQALAVSADTLKFNQATFGRGATTVSFKGLDFKLEVYIRAQTSYGFNNAGDLNDFRVYEFRGATGAVYGRFVPN